MYLRFSSFLVIKSVKRFHKFALILFLVIPYFSNGNINHFYSNTILGDIDEGSKQPTRSFIVGKSLIFDLSNPYIGIRRILIELKDTPDSGQYYARKYNEMVLKGANFMKKQNIRCPLKTDDSITRDYKEFEFFEHVWTYLYDSLKMEYSDRDPCLWKIFTYGELAMDCDRMSFFVFDIGKELKFKMGLYCLMTSNGSHVIVASGNYAFDPVTKAYSDVFSKDRIKIRFSIVFSYTENYQSVQSITYNELHWYWTNNNDFDKALHYAFLSYKADSTNILFLLALGKAYSDAGDFNNSFNCYSRSKDLHPMSGPRKKINDMVREAIIYSNERKISAAFNR